MRAKPTVVKRNPRSDAGTNGKLGLLLAAQATQAYFVAPDRMGVRDVQDSASEIDLISPSSSLTHYPWA